MMSPAVTAIEKIALGWLLEVLDLPRDAGWRLRDRRHHGELDGARRRAPRGTVARRLTSRMAQTAGCACAW